MIDIKSFNSLIELTDAFPTEEVCLKYFGKFNMGRWCGIAFRSENQKCMCAPIIGISVKTQVNHSMLKREQSLRTQSYH